MVGQWALVNDQSDEACAVCGTLFAVAGAAGVVAGAVTTVGDWVVAALGAAAVEGAVFTATGEVAGWVDATGAETIGALFAFEMVFAMATSVLPMPLSVFCTAIACDGVSVAFVASEAFNWPRVVASVLSTELNSFTCAAESPVTTVGVPASEGGTIPACISRFASVALATASSCWSVATSVGVSVCGPLVA